MRRIMAAPQGTAGRNFPKSNGKCAKACKGLTIIVYLCFGFMPPGSTSDNKRILILADAVVMNSSIFRDAWVA